MANLDKCRLVLPGDGGGDLALLGGAGIILLFRVGTHIDHILKENYDSVKFMVELNEAVALEHAYVEEGPLHLEMADRPLG